jgi:hypothetical protein
MQLRSYVEELANKPEKEYYDGYQKPPVKRYVCRLTKSMVKTDGEMVSTIVVLILEKNHVLYYHSTWISHSSIQFSITIVHLADSKILLDIQEFSQEYTRMH